MSKLLLNTPFQFFSKSECDKIIEQSKTLEWKQGWTMKGTGTWRTNTVCWYTLEDYHDLIRSHMISTTEHTIDWIYKPYQISRYETGQFYDWHEDHHPRYDHKSSKRNVTLTCTLQPAPGAAVETEHGRFELEKGWAVMFPATELHRATAPIEGERWAFTVWAMKRNKQILV